MLHNSINKAIQNSINKAIQYYEYMFWWEEQTTDTVGVVSSLGEAFIKLNVKC